VGPQLVELRVRNLGVIDDVTLSLGPGMTALTGETGAGKTLLVEALSLLLGGRADSSVVRAGTEEAGPSAVDPTGCPKARPVMSPAKSHSHGPCPGPAGPGRGSMAAWPRSVPWPRRPAG